MKGKIFPGYLHQMDPSSTRNIPSPLRRQRIPAPAESDAVKTPAAPPSIGAVGFSFSATQPAPSAPSPDGILSCRDREKIILLVRWETFFNHSVLATRQIQQRIAVDCVSGKASLVAFSMRSCFVTAFSCFLEACPQAGQTIAVLEPCLPCYIPLDKLQT